MAGRSPEGLRGRLALADLRWIWAGLIALVIFGALILLWPTYEKTLDAVCRARYARAATAAESLGVDALVPVVRDPKFSGQSVTCGTLRKAGRL